MTTAIDHGSPQSLECWLSEWMAGELGMDSGAIDTNKPFLSYGMDSVQSVMLVGDLESGLGRSLSPTLVWTYPTISELAAHLFQTSKPSTASGVETRNGQGSDNQKQSRETPALDPRKAEELLENLDDMTEDQIDELLSKYAR